MKPGNQPDVGAGLLFIAIGALTLWGAHGLRLGSAAAMGPGYFPTALALLLLVLGGVTLLRGWRGTPRALPRPALRTVGGLLLSIVLFGAVLQSLGLLLSAVGLVVGCRWAAGPLRHREVWLLGLVLGLSAVALFVHGLDVLLPTWPVWPTSVRGAG